MVWKYGENHWCSSYYSLVFGSALTAISDDPGKKGGITKGISLLASTSIGYWVYSALPKLVDASGLSISFPQMIGVFLGALFM